MRGKGGKFRGGAADSIPRPRLVCVPLTITCSTRADVSACHVVERTKAESNCQRKHTGTGLTP